MQQYDPNKVITQWGTFTFSGFSADEMVTVTPDNDQRGLHEGVDGGARHVKYQSKAGTISLKLADYSPGNAFLSAGDFGDLDAPFSIIDKTSAGDVFISPSAMVRRRPDFAKNKDPNENEWQLQYINGTFSYAGGAV